MHRFRYDNLSALKPGDPVELPRQEERHLFTILRASSGDRIGLLSGDGLTAIAEIGPDRRPRILSIDRIPEPEPRLHLYIAPPRRQKMDLLLKQAVELGVWRIVPLVCERSVALPSEDAVGGRWTDLLFEACKQSGNPYLPALSAPVRFLAGVDDARASCPLVFYGSPRTDTNLSGATPADMGLFIGPEGGFTPDEEKAMENAGFQPLRIGRWTLRVETAVAAGLAVLNARTVH